MSVPPGLDEMTAQFAADVRVDLLRSPRQLQSKYLYDALGSSLFEAICRLPWYRITRAESALLARHADAIVTSIGSKDGTIVELGCGSGEPRTTLRRWSWWRVKARRVPVGPFKC